MKPYLSTNGSYSIRLATCWGYDQEKGLYYRNEEEKEILRLRYKIFTEELKEGSRNQYKQDFDAFDKYCDFLVLICNKTKEIVGLYRILPFFKKGDIGYYSETEFKLDLPKENIAELGRLCIKKEHRGKGLLNLLWLGLIKYAKENDIKYFFGCGSLRPDSTLEGMRKIYWFLRNKNKILPSEEFNAIPLPPIEIREKLLAVNKSMDKDNFLIHNKYIIDIRGKQKVSKKEFDELCPSLIKRYLKVGTKVLGRPAYDPYFKCFDFLLLIDLRKVKMKVVNCLLKAQMLNKRIIYKICGNEIDKPKEKRMWDLTWLEILRLCFEIVKDWLKWNLSKIEWYLKNETEKK